jgi:hypothetical protein
MTDTTLSWAWASYGRRWHLRASRADLALCGAGRRGWSIEGGPFDPADIGALACLPCLRVERQTAATVSTAAGDGAG